MTRILFGLAVCLTLGLPAFAQTPETIAHQGVLEDNNGAPLSGNFVLTFRLYDAAADGNLIWQEDQGVSVENGLFNAPLGAVTPFDTLGFRRPYWLSVAVNAGAELQPRLPLAAVPYSMAARSLGDEAILAGANVSITRNADHALVIAATGGEGDGHSLDASDGSPEDALFVDGAGRVGIGTNNPAEALSVNGTIESLNGGFKFPDSTVQTTASNVGSALAVVPAADNNYRVFLNRDDPIGSEWFGIRAPISGNAYAGMYIEVNNPDAADDSGRPFYGYAFNGAFKAWHNWNGNSNAWELFVPNAAGLVVRQLRLDGDTGNLFVDGTLNGGGADLAEAFEVEGSTAAYEPGDVLVISTASDRRVEKSATPYSTLVAGVYATKPGVLLSEYGVEGAPADHVPMGVVGVVPTKVSGENGPIRRGDLLVTSGTPGRAMKADPDRLGFGMVLGKALENFDGAAGTIRVLVNVK